MQTENTSLDDSLSLEFVRLIEDGAEPNPLALTPTSEGDLHQVLVERSHILLPQYTSLTSSRLNLFIRLFIASALLLAVLLGMTIFPIAKAARILEGYEVNLAGPFFFFMVGQFIFLSISLCFFVITLISLPFHIFRNGHRQRKKRTLIGYILFGLMGSMIISAAFWFASLLLKWRLSLFQGKRTRNTTTTVTDGTGSTPHKSSDSNAPPTSTPQTVASSFVLMDREKNIRLFTDYFAQRARPFLFLSGVCTHLFWFAMSATMFVLLVIQMQSNEYKYRWKTSLGDVHQVHTVLETWGRPLGLLCQIPTTEDVEWLFQEHNSLVSSTDSVPTVQASQVRTRWSFFLLTGVLCYAVIPRIILVFGYLFFFRWSLREFRPDWKLSYYQGLMDRMRPTRIQSELVRLDDEKEEDLIEEKNARFSYLDKKNKANQEEKKETKPVSRTRPEHTLILAYEATLLPAKWNFLGPLAASGTTFDNVTASRKALADFRLYMQEHAEEISRCIVLTDCSIPPARQTMLFLQRDLLELLPCEASLYIILSCGEQLRRKFPADSPAVSQRLNDWQQTLEELARVTQRAIVPITFYDHQLDIPAARSRLITALDGEQTAKSAMASTVPVSTYRPERTRDAFALVRREANALFNAPNEISSGENDDSDQAEERSLQIMTSLYQKLSQLYREEDRSLLDSACRRFSSWFHTEKSAVATGDSSEDISENKNIMSPIAERLKQESAKLGIGLEDAANKLVPSLDIMNQTKQFCSRLNPRWALGAASVGAAIPVAVTLAPLLGGTLTLSAVAGVVGGLGTLLPSTVAGGAAGAVVGAAIPASWKLVKDRVRAEFQARFPRRSDVADDSRTHDSFLSDVAVQVHTLVASACVWITIFELQGRPEQEVVDTLPLLVRPLDSAVCSSPETTEEILDAVERNITDFQVKRS